MFNLNTCQHCGYIHCGACPKIKSIEYFPNGNIKKIEYHENAWPWTNLPWIDPPAAKTSVPKDNICITPKMDIQVII